MLRNKTFAPEFCSLISNWFDMREQAPGANLLHESVSGASSLVCTGLNVVEHFAGWKFCSREWILPMKSLVHTEELCSRSVRLEQNPGAKHLVCTGWGTYPGACFGSVFQEQAPSCVPALTGVAGQISKSSPNRFLEVRKDFSLYTVFWHDMLLVP